MQVVSHSAEETKRLGADLATCVQPGDVVVLNGDLGAGKTQFVQGVAEALGVQGAVTSPTFNILLTYDCEPASNGDGSEMGHNPANHPTTLNHFDLYRLESAEELDDIGYWEILEGDGVSFIEWGDKFPNEMPDDYLAVSITANADGSRTIQATPFGPRSEVLLSAWKHGGSIYGEGCSFRL